MKLPDVLQGIRQLAFDTAPLIYFIERHPDYFDRMLIIMRYVDEGLISGVSATMALTEVLVQPLKAGDTALAKRYEAALTNSKDFRLEPLTTSIAHLAADLRARYNLKTPDAIHVATAIDAGCDGFLTNDTGIKRVSEIKVLVLDAL
ncbi:MAG: PIN domain-containing protein [Anaerolineaceae bacterium]|nr:MAG: PIN domain-containing protein [Anaerolineaceae bacterium]